MAGFRRLYRRTLAKRPSNPSLYARLRWLDKMMLQHPEWIVTANEEQLARIARLVDGVLDDLVCNDYVDAEIELSAHSLTTHSPTLTAEIADSETPHGFNSCRPDERPAV